MHVEHLPVPTARSTQLARNVASGKECIPALLVLGGVLEFLANRTPRRPDEALLVVVPSTLGPCRTGQYHVFYDRLFDELGLDNVALLVSGDESSYGELGHELHARPVARASCSPTTSPTSAPGCASARATPARAWPSSSAPGHGVLAALERGTGELAQALARARDMLAAIPRRRSLADVKKVLVVGEIYVRRDNFSVYELSEHLISQGIFPKLAGGLRVAPLHGLGAGRRSWTPRAGRTAGSRCCGRARWPSGSAWASRAGGSAGWSTRSARR